MIGNATRATAALTAVIVTTSCSCGVLGFVAPTAGGALAVAGGRRGEGRIAVPKAMPATRPRGLLRLYSSKEPLPGGTDFVDALAKGARAMTTEEKIAALQREVQSQVPIADEEEAKMTPEETAATEVDDEEELGPDKFRTSADFVDEGKNIIWPNPRRAIQLTVLAVAAQIAFIVYIISLNAFLNNVPIWFGKFVDAYKAGNIRLPDL